jgi:hypothetical protein
MARVAVCAIGAALGCFGDVIYLGPQPGGGGFGSVGTILTVQSPNNTTEASGCVGWFGGETATGRETSAVCGGDVAGGDEKMPSEFPHNQAFLLSDVGSTGNIGILFNATQSAGGSITIDRLIISLFSSNGSILWSSSGLVCPVGDPNVVCQPNGSLTLLSTEPGIGNAGFGFGLDATQAAAASAFAGSAVRIGLSTKLSGSVAGQETFQLFTRESGDSPVPEPSAYALMGGGLAAICAWKKKFATR